VHIVIQMSFPFENGLIIETPSEGLPCVCVCMCVCVGQVHVRKGQGRRSGKNMILS
jgi:hypothetical protein